MKSYKFTLYLGTDKKKKNGKMPLYIRFRRIDGEEPIFPLGIAYQKRNEKLKIAQEKVTRRF